MFDDNPEDRLPTALWVDAHLRQVSIKGQGYYIMQKGAYAGGMVLLKLSNMAGQCRLLQQQRDLEGVLGWMNAFSEPQVEEREADAYMRRAMERDPDLWVIEIEDREMANPFEGKEF